MQITKESELVSARLSPKEIEKIGMLINEGFYMNTADFVRMAIREKLESVKILDIRNVPKEKAKKEIVEYLMKNRKVYPSDIADSLQIDYDLVLEVIKELMEESRIM